MDNPLPQSAHEARQLLKGRVMMDAWAAAEELFVKEWKEADTTERREFAHAKVMGIAEVRRVLRIVLSDGEHGSRA